MLFVPKFDGDDVFKIIMVSVDTWHCVFHWSNEVHVEGKSICQFFVVMMADVFKVITAAQLTHDIVYFT